MRASNKFKGRGKWAIHVHKARGNQKTMQGQKLKSALCFMSAAFQITIVNLKQLYHLGLLLKLDETNLTRKLRKSDFRWLKLAEL